MNDATAIRLLSGQDRSARARALRAALSAAEPGYRLAVKLRNRLYDAGWARPRALGRPTLSVGNLTAGGTGKTPMVIELSRKLQARGAKPAVLLRGYRGRSGRGGDAGDEAALPASDEAAEIALALGQDAVVEPDPDRVAAAARVVRRAPGVGAFVLDDGFQHRRAARDLDVVLIDATRPFGFDRLLPRGLLREPAENLARADAVILTRADHADAEGLAALERRIARLTGRPPVALTAHGWSGCRVAARGVDPAHDNPQPPQPTEALAEHTVYGVCGIGNPGAFEAMLRAAAGRVVGFEPLDDHAAPGPAALDALLRRAAATGADAVVTTEKDWVKWAAVLAGRPLPVAVWRPIVSLRWLRGEPAVDELLAGLLADQDAAGR